MFKLKRIPVGFALFLGRRLNIFFLTYNSGWSTVKYPDGLTDYNLGRATIRTRKAVANA